MTHAVPRMGHDALPCPDRALTRRETGTRLVVESMVLRTGESRVDLITRTPQDDGNQRVAVDAGALREYLRGLFLLR